MSTMSEKIAAHIDQLATQVIPPEHLASFLVLAPRDKAAGLATLAHAAGDTAMREACRGLLAAFPSYYLEKR